MELLIVTSVVTLLLSIMLPSFRRAREDARRTVCLANLKHVGVGLFSYSADNQDQGPMVMEPREGEAPRNLLSIPGQMVNMGLMVPHVIQDAKLFYCPSQSEFDHSTDLDLLGRQFIAGSYAYAVNVPARKSPKLGSIRHLAMVSDDFVAPSVKLGLDVGIGRYSHRVGYNVLYTDGSATWYSDADESIWKRAVRWDNELDNITYSTLYKPGAEDVNGPYGRALDIFRVWHSFCYARPDPFQP